MIFPRKPEACPLLTVNFLSSFEAIYRFSRIMMSKVHSVPRKQGRRPAGTDFVHLGVESLFASGATGVYGQNNPFISKRELI